MSTLSNDETSSSLNGGIGGMMSDVDSGLALSSTTDEIQDHSSMMDFQTLLQQLPTSSAPQNVSNSRIYTDGLIMIPNIMNLFLIHNLLLLTTDYN